MKKVIFWLLLSLILSFSSKNVLADDPYGSCQNPQGQVIASYQNGVHGIVGRIDSYTGADAVYKISDENVLQCFCPDSGNGIQSNWLKADQLSDSDIAVYKSEGWVYIPNGSLWGLEDVPYLAKNIDYSCKQNNNNNSSSSNNSSANSEGGPAILGISTNIASFAPTGSAKLILGLFSLGLGLLILSLIFKKLFQKN